MVNLNTIITEKTDNGEVSYDVFGKLVEKRILFICGEIDDGLATDISATLLHLDTQDDTKEISLYMNTPGGDIRNIFMIYDIMKLITSPIKTYCMGTVSNEAALLLAAGTPGLRYATKNSTISMSELHHTGSHYSDMSNAEIYLKQSISDNDKFIEALSLNTKKSVKTLQKDCIHTFYLTSPEAKKYGIIDQIIESK